MAVLETIRVKFGILISVLIALALLSFIIDPTTLQSVSSAMSSANNVGDIDGKTITYNDFSSYVDKYTTVFEVSRNSSVKSDEDQKQIREMAWQSLINKYLFVKNANAAGIYVGEEEMVDLVSGDMTSSVFSQNPMFFDESGKFSKDILVQTMNYLNQDPRLQVFKNYLQESAYNEQYYAKYLSLFNSGNVLNPLMLENRIADNNNSFDVEFVMAPMTFATDSTINITDKEVRKFYNDHKKFFRQQASRDIDYVVYEVVPSKEDISAANQAVVDLYDEFKAADDVKRFMLANSDVKYEDRWYAAGELNPVSKVVNDYVFGGANVGEVSQVLEDNNTFYAVRVLASQNVPNEVFVKHILVDNQNLADSLCTVAGRNTANFAELAARYSLDQNKNVEEAGDIAWMNQNNMIPGFESVFTTPVRKPGVIKTQYGWHVVMVTETKDITPKKKVAVLAKETVASKETINGYYAQANTFASRMAAKKADFATVCDSLGVYAHSAKLYESTDRLGAIENTKEITRWAFDTKVGKVSEIKTINNHYFIIATLKGIQKEGYTDLDKVAPQIKSELYNRQYAENRKAEVAKKIEGLTDLNAIAEALGTTVSTKEDLTFASMAGQGLDPKFIGAASVAEVGKVYGPVAGNIGIYVYKVTNKEVGGYFTEDDAKMQDAQRSQYAANMIVNVMEEDAEVKDHRARFF
ncbi:MAG: peptidylprolyl isomerase [Candidatus Cryptobacteroides sp.]